MRRGLQWHVLAGIVVIAVWALPAQAFLRWPYEDAQVVERTELMVVGAIKDGSVVFVPHDSSNGRGRSWEYHATLVIHEVLKGECKQKELPIVIRYGLSVLVDGKMDRAGLETGKDTALPKAEKSMAIVDTGSLGGRRGALAEDAREDHLWMLRHGGERAEADDHGFGIVDPEDVQPVELKKYLLCYLGHDPEAGVRASLQEHPEIAARAVRYLEHCEVQRIVKEADMRARVQRLLPYYQSRASWANRWEAREAIVAAGEVAGPYLMAAYEGTWEPERRVDIVGMWGEIRYKGAAEVLIRVLEEEDRFWAGQELKKGWAEGDSPLATRRVNSYRLIFAAVKALGEMREPKARAALELTRLRWKALAVDAPTVEAAEQALAAVGPIFTTGPATQK